MHKAAIGIIGASGYSGVEATHLLAAHERVELRLVTSDRWKGETVGRRLGIQGPVGSLAYAPQDKSLELARECEVVLLATPAETSLELAPGLLAAGVRVIDLSGAFRLRDTAAYPAFYNFAHSAPALLEEAVYGLPELSSRERIAQARLVANPGCYATACALAVAPLLRAGVLEKGSVIFDAASGTTGAGRKGSEDLSFSEVDEDFRAYRVLRHQHTPEIAQTLAGVAGHPVPLTFTAHLLPLKRGILVTAYARLAPGATAAQAQAALREAYATSPFLSVETSPDAVSLKGVVGTNRCAVALAVDAGGHDPGRVVVTAAIDNLVKGAAGQAVQNLNLMKGWAETTALASLRSFSP
ncbi:N-acetyl-gamma-glutamyl-phosphate reductase [Archangium primigenium]|uniref:N-acetyl-gamma-glutamyl-phosphate reductase n=1 Tax=[Archangium] primigenium TaxID=2792470 RepID=UPI00195E0F39|nr:N-acetyl-gamma-glutamyl-phosphate reductase [Archangium primigenium]MBM7115950.1 N-acetyl-gamma-glutamyl-phosphate reductase [Archangium primigenium]